jgi:hypothetical protein
VAGYSGTPLVQKLGIKPGATVYLLNVPPEIVEAIGDLPTDARFVKRAPKNADVVIAPVASLAALVAVIDNAKAAMAPHGGLWVCWPKKSSGVTTDVDENAVREAGLAEGLVDNKVCAVTSIWSGLRLVVRVKDRPEPAPRASTVRAAGSKKR